MVGQLILSLSILVVLHEAGHFFPAKLFGCRVEKFYLFFDPWFELFKFKKGETEYGIGWLPLGGYVKISGMIDESFDKEQMAQEPQAWEFRSKPAWQRLIIMVGGVVVNFLLGFFLWAMVLFNWGEDYLPPENAKFGIATDSLAQAIGLRDGDHIKSVNNIPVVDLLAFKRDMIINQARSIQLVRNNQPMEIPVSAEHATEVSRYKYHKTSLVKPRFPLIIDSLPPDLTAFKAGMKEGDKIVGFNEKGIEYFHEFSQLARKNKGKTANVRVKRGADTLALSMAISEKGTIGVIPKATAEYMELVHKDYSFGESIPAGIQKGASSLKDMVIGFYLMFNGSVKVQDSLGSFITIGKLFSDTWDWRRFWTLTALLSIILGFMNILPIPLLDGGHVVFLLYEMIAGRPPNERFQEYAHLVGMLILVTLMLGALGLDIARHLGFFG